MQPGLHLPGGRLPVLRDGAGEEGHRLRPALSGAAGGGGTERARRAGRAKGPLRGVRAGGGRHRGHHPQRHPGGGGQPRRAGGGHLRPDRRGAEVGAGALQPRGGPAGHPDLVEQDRAGRGGPVPGPGRGGRRGPQEPGPLRPAAHGSGGQHQPVPHRGDGPRRLVAGGRVGGGRPGRAVRAGGAERGGPGPRDRGDPLRRLHDDQHGRPGRGLPGRAGAHLGGEHRAGDRPQRGRGGRQPAGVPVRAAVGGRPRPPPRRDGPGGRRGHRPRRLPSPGAARARPSAAGRA